MLVLPDTGAALDAANESSPRLIDAEPEAIMLLRTGEAIVSFFLLPVTAPSVMFELKFIWLAVN